MKVSSNNKPIDDFPFYAKTIFYPEGKVRCMVAPGLGELVLKYAKDAAQHVLGNSPQNLISAAEKLINDKNYYTAPTAMKFFSDWSDLAHYVEYYNKNRSEANSEFVLTPGLGKLIFDWAIDKKNRDAPQCWWNHLSFDLWTSSPDEAVNPKYIYAKIKNMLNILQQDSAQCAVSGDLCTMHNLIKVLSDWSKLEYILGESGARDIKKKYVIDSKHIW